MTRLLRSADPNIIRAHRRPGKKVTAGPSDTLSLGQLSLRVSWPARRKNPIIPSDQASRVASSLLVGPLSLGLDSHLPVIAVLGRVADAGGVVPAGSRMLVAVGQPLVAELAGPAGPAAALPGLPAAALGAARIGHALGAVGPGVADLAAAGIGPPAAPGLGTAAIRADCCGAE